MNTRMYWVGSCVVTCCLLLMGGCCEKCDKGYIGEFALQQGSGDWMTFAATSSRLFRNQNGQTLAMIYDPVSSGVEDLTQNCTELNCGSCCDEFRGTYLYGRFSSADGQFVFDITLRKNFLDHNVKDDPVTIDDYFSISFNNTLTCDLLHIPDTVLTGGVTLNGKTFFQVFSCETNAGNQPESPRAYYFTRSQGIVGFRLNNGDTWSLD
ncbi:MAG: hypothetical protein SF053_14405 [Bacteroidia bacterium]|nr:hypothetical protein [Bacteroidia bacterium]